MADTSQWEYGDPTTYTKSTNQIEVDGLMIVSQDLFLEWHCWLCKWDEHAQWRGSPYVLLVLFLVYSSGATVITLNVTTQVRSPQWRGSWWRSIWSTNYTGTTWLYVWLICMYVARSWVRCQVLWHSSLHKNQYFQIPIRPGKRGNLLKRVPRTLWCSVGFFFFFFSRRAWYRWIRGVIRWGVETNVWFINKGKLATVKIFESLYGGQFNFSYQISW